MKYHHELIKPTRFSDINYFKEYSNPQLISCEAHFLELTLELLQESHISFYSSPEVAFFNFWQLF